MSPLEIVKQREELDKLYGLIFSIRELLTYGNPNDDWVATSQHHNCSMATALEILKDNLYNELTRVSFKLEKAIGDTQWAK